MRGLMGRRVKPDASISSGRGAAMAEETRRRAVATAEGEDSFMVIDLERLGGSWR